MKVQNLINANGNANANQFVINDGNKIYFQSYDSIVCKIENGKVTLGKDWNYSTTTSKHLYTFLKQNGFYELADRKAILKAIKNKELEVKDL